MTDRLLKELLELKRNNNIDETIFKRILSSIRKKHKNLQNDDVHVLKVLFSGNVDSKILEIISLLLSMQLISLKEVPSYLEFITLTKDNCDSNHLTNIVLAYKIYHNSKSTVLSNHVISADFLTKREEEASFLKEIYLFINSFTDCEELAAKYFGSTTLSRQIMEDSSIKIEDRLAIFALINKKYVFINDDYVSLILKRFKINQEAAIWTSKFLKSERITSNETILNFIMDEANLPLMCGETFIALNSAELTDIELQTLISHTSIKAKLAYLRDIISSHYLAKKTRASVIDAFESTLGLNYDLYLNGTISEEELLQKVGTQNITDDIARINF